MDLRALNERVSAARRATEARGETFYPGPSRVHLAAFPPKERWNDWVELDSKAWPARVEKRYMLVPTTCFNCESACGLLAYVDRETLQVRKFEGNPEHPGSRGRNCAKGPATLNQVTDPDRILYPLKRAGRRGEGKWVRVTWEEALADLAGRIRRAIVEERPNGAGMHWQRPNVNPMLALRNGSCNQRWQETWRTAIAHQQAQRHCARFARAQDEELS